MDPNEDFTLLELIMIVLAVLFSGRELDWLPHFL